MKLPVYLDNHATTPVDPEVLKTMLPFFCENFGNAMSGQHRFGWTAKNAIEVARGEVASLIAAQPREILFTSGATESIHTAILGAFQRAEDDRGQKFHLITCATEHKAVLEVAARIEKLGHAVTRLTVDEFGEVDLDDVKNAMRPDTLMISLMHANNEVGTIHPIAEIGRMARAKNVFFHVDASQSLGKISVDVERDHIDLLSGSAHKMYGPKGSGFLYIRQSEPRVKLVPYFFGGGQEKNMRGGTHNVPGIVGLGKACSLAQEHLTIESQRVKELRDGFLTELRKLIPSIRLNGHPTNRLCNNLNVSIDGIYPDQLLLGLDDVAFSSASACSAGADGVSYVLKALGRQDGAKSVTLRFGLGRWTTKEELDYVVRKLAQVIEKSKNLSI